MTTTQQKKIAARIRALLAKSVENGATEQEALAAMQKAREMMDKYGLTAEAIEADAETIAPQNMRRDNFKTFYIKDWLAYEVARYCDCKTWMNRKSGTYTFFGTEADRQFAIWLLDSLDQFIRNATIRFMEERGYRGGSGPWNLQKGFMLGCITRINERLHQLSEERIRASKPKGRRRSLVLVKNQLVENAFAKLNMKLPNYKGSAQMLGDNRAFAAGRQAGERATFNRPVNGNGEAQAIAG